MKKKTLSFITAMAAAAAMVPNVISGTAHAEENSLPASCDLSSTYLFPTINNQSFGSCASHSTTYYQFSYEARKKYFEKTGIVPNFSYDPLYTYNQINYGIDEGSTIVNAYNVLKNKGAVPYGLITNEILTESEYEQLSEVEKLGYYSRLYYDKQNDVYYNKYIANHNYIVNDMQTKCEALKVRLTDVHSKHMLFLDKEHDLNVLKSWLNDGKVITTSGDFNYDVKENLRTAKNPYNGKTEYALAKNVHSDDDPGHAFTIVGYDDNIVCDVNNDGYIDEEKEKGAFKIANSHGKNWMNDGYLWVMYDAVYYTSEFSELNGKNSAGLKRVPAFSSNRFYTIDVDFKDVKLISEAEIETSNFYDIDVSTYNNGHIVSIDNNVYATASDHNLKSEALAYNGSIISDITELCDENYLNGSNFNVKVHNHGEDTKINVKAIRLRDDKGNLVAEKIIDDDTSEDEGYVCDIIKSISLDIKPGDVNYDGIVDDSDRDAINSYISGDIYSFSLLQQDIMDIDHDGSITEDDITSFNELLK